MNYKGILENDEKVLHVSGLHIFVLVFPLVFTGVFGVTFFVGGYFIPEFREMCYIIAAIFASYPFVVIFLLINTKWVITTKRIIEQAGVIRKTFRSTPLEEIKKVSFHQTGAGRVLKCGDVSLKLLSREKKAYYRFFKYITRPHEFIVKLNDILGELGVTLQ